MAGWRMKKEKAGIVCTGGHLVEVAFTEEDFLHLWGGGPEDYRDFLLARMERLRHLEEKKGIEPLYHITVPFDRQDFAAWLSSDPRGAKLRDPLGHWALAVARDPLKLCSLCLRHENRPGPVFVRPDEQLDVEVVAWLVAVEVDREARLQEFLKPLPPRFLESLWLALSSSLYGDASPEPPAPFQRLSRLRARGAGVAPFDRFAAPEKLPRLEKNTAFLFRRGRFHEPPVWIPLAGRYRFRPRPEWRYPRRVVLCLPFLVAGSKVDVSLTTLRMIGDVDLNRGLMQLWDEYLPSPGLECCLRPGRFAAAPSAPEAAQEIADEP